MGSFTTTSNSVIYEDQRTFSKSGVTAAIKGDEVVLTSASGNKSWGINYIEDTLDGVSHEDVQSLFDVVKTFAAAGGGGGMGIQTVTGVQVDNTDDQNPVINAPTWAQVSGKPTTFAPIVGTAANQAMAGNTAIPAAATWANISGKPAVVAEGATAAAARTVLGLGTAATTASTAYATSAQGALAATAVQPADIPTALALPAALGTAGQVLAVNATGDGLEWITPV